MRQLIALLIVGLFAFSLIIGCGQKAEQETDKMPAETKMAEEADSTRMDSATLMDSVETMADSMIDEAKDAAKEAIDGM